MKKFKQSNLIKGSSIYFLVNMILQGISFITLIIYPRLLGTTENYGEVSFIASMLSISTCIISLGLSATVVRAKYDFKNKFDSYLSSILFLATISLIVSLVIVLLFRNQISRLIGFELNIILILILQSFFSFVINIAIIKCTVTYDYKKFIVISLTNAVLNIALCSLLIISLKENKYMGKIYGDFVITSVYGTFIFIFIMLRGKKLVNIKYWKYALSISLPLIPHTLSAILLVSLDTIMMHKLIGANATGIYSFAYKIGMIITIFWTAINKAWVPDFFENMDKKNYDSIKRKYKYYMVLFSMVTFVLIFISPEIFKIISIKAYSGGLNLVPIIMFAYFFVFLYNFPANLEFYEKKTYLISCGTVLAVVINGVLNYFFMPIYGYVTAAITTLVSYIVLFIYHYIAAKHISKEKIFEIKYFIMSIVFMTITTCTFYLLKDNYFARYIIILLLGVILYYKFKSKFKILLCNNSKF
ncbi:lipopolysaccharide biosynthesis protein [Clostridium sp. ZS2-4]|uniref:lipopolysaccharide biosynthesis protein n=1 Tax=Clostridium sp. ZS2-4 TaxID=2987703 RepID=UPI00227A2504|nr:oligosaccharide flippase family protein [Clostridium sp. ZS2-4]MCY6354132.1 oligosaccharide flippase family protein [Clostridium sp. ZS2-4]